MNVHAPNKRRERVAFWESVKDRLSSGNWVLVGDFNQVEVLEDARGKSTMIRGREARQWRDMVIRPEGRQKKERMSAEDLKDPRAMNLVKEAWLNETAYVRDDRRKWARRWYRVKQVLKAERDAKEKIRREEGELDKEVAWRREVILEDPSPAEVEMLDSLEQRLKIRDLEDAKRWRLCSRVRWLSTEDAPSRYFFAKLRAKWAKESLRAIELEDGMVSTDAEEILQELQRFYQVLYTAEEDTEERSRARDEVIGLVSKNIPMEERNQVARIHDRGEIEGVVFWMKSGKAPGVDGLTADMVAGHLLETVVLSWSKLYGQRRAF
ncbi:hypothetical protein R1sor_011013 [Riccia sorocarpa]|uniref:Reverse transcriptase n=1 Tax=Riccia sorocarpa TaxID=122646 RepID=A0ABD3I2E5_9MARC